MISVNFTFSRSDLSIDDRIGLPKEECRTLSSQLFDYLKNNYYDHFATSPRKEVLASMTRVHGGGSGAEAIRLQFNIPGQESPLGSFLIKICASTDNAEMERAHARKLASTAGDCFSAEVVEAEIDNKKIVIYRDASDQLGQLTKDLKTAILEIFTSKKSGQLTALADEAANTIKRLNIAYRTLEVPILIESEQYQRQLRRILPPSLLIDCIGRVLVIQPDVSERICIMIEKIDGSGASPSKAQLISYEKMRHLTQETARVEERWLKIDAVFEKSKHMTASRDYLIIKSKIENRYIWLFANAVEGIKALAADCDAAPGRGISIMFHSTDINLVKSDVGLLREMGLSLP